MFRGLVVLTLVVQAIPAFAQEPPPPPPPPPSSGNPGLLEDPNIDRAWFSPTAATQPKGSFSFNDYELVFLGATYGVTDNFQLTAVIFPPLTTDVPFIGMLSGKVGLPVSDRIRVAASLAIGHVRIDDDSVTVGIGGGAISFCTDGPCASLFSLYLYGGFSLDEEDEAIPIGYGASLVQRVARHVKLVLDLGSGGAIASSDAVFAEGVILGYGVRFFSDNIAGDIGFVRPFFFDGEGDDVSDSLVLGLPVVTFSYRF